MALITHQEKTFARPRVVISKCLEFAACRYNGQMIPDLLVRNLQKFVDVVTVCPEEEIGLGTPRKPIHIAYDGQQYSLLQPDTGREVGGAMKQFAHQYLESVEQVDGFILKSKSPSCGIGDVRVHTHKGPPKSKRSGYFAEEVVQRFSHLAVEHEGRLKDVRLREHFLTRLFVFAEFRELPFDQGPAPLVAFQARHKFLFTTYNQTAMRLLGRLIAGAKGKPPGQLREACFEQLCRIFRRLPPLSAHVNTLQHLLGYFKKELSAEEKQHFLSLVEKIPGEDIPLWAPRLLIESWIERFENSYLAQQSYLAPYPSQLHNPYDKKRPVAR